MATFERLDKTDGVILDNVDLNATYNATIALPAKWNKALRELAIDKSTKTRKFVCISDIVRDALQAQYGLKFE